MKKHIDISHMISMYMLSYWLLIFRLFLDIKLLWQSKWPWRWNNDNTHQCAQPPTALQNMRSIMLNIKQIVSRKEENGVYSSKRGLMEHVKRRKVGVYYIAIPHICHGHHGPLEVPNQNSKTTFIAQTFPKYGPYGIYFVNLSLLGAIWAIFQFCGFSGLFWPFSFSLVK